MHTILRYRDTDGSVVEIGPDHPDYSRLLAEYRKTHPAPTISRWKMLAYGVFSLAVSTAVFWDQWHSIQNDHKVSYKAEGLAGLMLVCGVLLLTFSALPQRWYAKINEPHGLGIGWTMGGGAALLVLSGSIAWCFHHWALAQLGYR